MSKHTPPLYALTPITETEGLPDGQYRCLNKYGKESDVKYSFDDGRWLAHVAIELYQFTHYLRPLSEGMVAMSERDIQDFVEWVSDGFERETKKGWANLWFGKIDFKEYTTKELYQQFIQTKLAQMGE